MTERNFPSTSSQFFLLHLVQILCRARTSLNIRHDIWWMNRYMSSIYVFVLYVCTLHRVMNVKNLCCRRCAKWCRTKWRAGSLNTRHVIVAVELASEWTHRSVSFPKFSAISINPAPVPAEKWTRFWIRQEASAQWESLVFWTWVKIIRYVRWN